MNLYDYMMIVRNCILAEQMFDDRYAKVEFAKKIYLVDNSGKGKNKFINRF